ncbi:DNA topoisomerase IV, partial [Sulfurimonas sp.]|nr:DNA topoisomerase IV [Sulfurimonas sp.]
MKILLLNENPVVTKLVTLSAQKTSDDLEVVNSIDAVESDSYDLLVIDDTMYSSETMQELNEKATITKSLYICSKDAPAIDSFTSTLKKPFLPTDLVELFASLGQDADTFDLGDEEETVEDELEIHDELDEEDDLEIADDINLDLDDLELIEEDEEELEIPDESDENADNVLDKDELKEVQDLL